MRATRYLIAAAVLTVATAAACAAQPPSARPQHTTTAANLSCAWPTAINARTGNVAIPDAAAAYWLQPIVATPTTVLRISGRYPDTRYFSLSVYTPSGDEFTSNGAGSSLPDYRIAAAPGSVNPWQRATAPGGSYDITVSAAASAGQANVLPLPSGTTSAHPGYLV